MAIINISTKAAKIAVFAFVKYFDSPMKKASDKCIICFGDSELMIYDERGYLTSEKCSRCGGTGDELLARVKLGGDMWIPQ